MAGDGKSVTFFVPPFSKWRLLSKMESRFNGLIKTIACVLKYIFKTQNAPFYP